jgi:hypothetical protein
MCQINPGRASMGKKLFLSSLVFLAVLYLCNSFSFAQPGQKSKADPQQKSGSAKIVIEYVFFPDVLKQYDVYPWETLNIAEFQKAYMEMLGSKKREEWIPSLTGTGDRNRMLHVFKEHLLLIASCKPHACDASQLIVLFNPLSKKCWAVFAENGKFDYLGNPDDKINNLLKILLVEEYKDVYKSQ